MERIPVGIEGLDRILKGGVSSGGVYLVLGYAGSGKTTLGLTFLRTGLMAGEKVMLVSLERDPHEILGQYSDLRSYKEAGSLHVADMGALRMAISHDEEVRDGLGTLRSIEELISGFVRAEGITRLLIEPLNATYLHYSSRHQYRRELFRFVRAIRGATVTTFLVAESTEMHARETEMAVEHHLCDGVIRLIMEDNGSRIVRYLLVAKMKGTDPDSSYYQFQITDKGIVLNSG